MFDSAENSDSVTLGGITFTAEGVFEGEVPRPNYLVPKASIERICLRYGFLARHPILLTLFGIVLIVLGLASLAHVGIWLFGGGGLFFWEAAAAAWLILGAGALWGASRRGYLLDIKAQSGWKRLEFGKGVKPPELMAFVAQAEKCFGYSVEMPTFRAHEELP
jgi:hypothetical protein